MAHPARLRHAGPGGYGQRLVDKLLAVVLRLTISMSTRPCSCEHRIRSGPSVLNAISEIRKRYPEAIQVVESATFLWIAATQTVERSVSHHAHVARDGCGHHRSNRFRPGGKDHGCQGAAREDDFCVNYVRAFKQESSSSSRPKRRRLKRLNRRGAESAETTKICNLCGLCALRCVYGDLMDFEPVIGLEVHANC